MKVICVNHKGGVGKTTTALHITGVFLETGNRVLLVDADSSARSFRFFTEGSVPKLGGEILITQEDMLYIFTKSNQVKNKSWVDNYEKLIKKQSFDHIVIDVLPSLEEISTLLIQIKPDLVLLTVKRDDIGSFDALNDMLLTLEMIRPITAPMVKIVPIGVVLADFQEYIDSRYNDFQVLEPVDWLPKEVGNTVFKPPYEYIWNHLGCEHLWDYYNRVIME